MPLTWISHQFDVSLFGMNPGAMHMVSALDQLPTGDVWLVYRGGSFAPAAAVAGVTWTQGHFLVAAATASAGAAAYALLMGPYALRDPLGVYTRKYGRALLARVRGA